MPSLNNKSSAKGLKGRKVKMSWDRMKQWESVTQRIQCGNPCVGFPNTRGGGGKGSRGHRIIIPKSAKRRLVAGAGSAYPETESIQKSLMEGR